MYFIRSFILTTAIVVLAGCSAHSPFITQDTTNIEQAQVAKYPPNTNRVFVTSQSLPATVQYEVLGTLEVGKVWYGSSGKVLDSLADGARQLGADAVVDVKTWHQPSGWSWAAPHGSGKAVKITDPAGFDFNRLEGELK